MKINKNLLTSTLPLLISIFLFVIVGKVGIGRVSALREEIADGEKERKTLTEKLNTLRTLGGELGSNSVASTYALPESNPVLAAMSQLKLAAAQNVISMSSLKSGAGAKGNGGISSVDISFEAVGPKEGILAFVNGLTKVAPIMQLNKLKLSETGGQTRAAISIRAYFAELPTKIPAVDSPVKLLTADEEETLMTVTALTPPQFSEVLPSAAGKTDPFSQ